MIKPSQVLESLSQSLPPDSFRKLLTEYLYPALDALPNAQRDNITLILQEAQGKGDRAQAVLKQIAFEKHKKSLEGGIKALVKHVKRDWHDGYEEQGEMMKEIANEIAKWLPALWKAGVENRLEIPLIQKCLVLCSNTLEAVGSTNSRAEFSDFDFKVVIKDSAGKTVYSERRAPIDQALYWLWRELALSAIAHDVGQKTISNIVSEIERLKLVDEVEGLLRNEEESETAEDYDFHDSHWSEGMKGAVPRFRLALNKSRMSAFETTPTVPLYSTLVAQSPNLQPALLETTRQKVFAANPTISYTVAAHIFCKATQTDDLLKLLDALPRFTFNPAVPDTRKIVVKYLSVQPSADLRSKGLKVVDRELRHAMEVVWEEIERAFPGYEDALEWLEEKVDEGKLVKKEPMDMPRDKRVKRNTLLKIFIDRASRDECGYNSGYGGYGDSDEDMRGVDEEDSDYEEQKEARRPDLAKRIEIWTEVLLSWPDKEEAAKMWEQFQDSDDLFYDVDDVAESLASRCDWEWNHSGAKQYVADGIRAMYKAFSCPTLDALQKIQPEVIKVGGFSSRRV